MNNEHVLFIEITGSNVNRFSTYNAVIFDQDGTIYLGDELLPGARETVAALRESGTRTIFL